MQNCGAVTLHFSPSLLKITEHKTNFAAKRENCKYAQHSIYGNKQATEKTAAKCIKNTETKLLP